MTVSVIIVNYNTASFLKACIDSVCFFEKDVEKEFVIVDNKSDYKDEIIIDSIIAENPCVRKIMLNKNYGFAYANNRGVESCNSEYILILNPDILFTQSTFHKITASMKDTEIGAVGVKLYGSDNRFQNQYYQKPPSFFQYLFFYSVFAKLFNRKEKYEKKYLLADIDENAKISQRVNQLPGAFIFMRKKVYDEFKGFNESFFLFFEDVDLTYRISKKYHLEIEDINVIHTGASSMIKDADYIYGYYVLSLHNYFRNNYSVTAFLFLKFAIFVNTIIKITVEFVKKLLNVNKPGILKVHLYILSKLFK